MDIENAVLDPTVGEIMFVLFGFWFAMWFTFTGLMWTLRILAAIRMGGGRW